MNNCDVENCLAEVTYSTYFMGEVTYSTHFMLT